MTVKEYNRIVDQHADGMYRFAYSMCKNEDAAKDGVQDAFVKLWERKENVDPSKVKSYLFTTVHHKIIDGFRRASKHQDIDQTVITESTSQKSHDLQEILHQALNTLPEIQRSVILLRDYEGYNYEEIAEVTELTLSQVKVYIFRGRQKLKEYIGSIEAVL
ncbi:RNA polymerase sigma factor [Salibacteraceae bacterium]|nr:RNA polymerase sigma factor [Salibacteraceae bacterium]